MRSGSPCRSTTSRSRRVAAALRDSSSTRAAAERLGFDSLWLSDHLFLDLAKYGGPPDRYGALRAARHARRRWPALSRAPARHARALRGAAPRGGAGQGARHARPPQRRPARHRDRRRLVRARLRGHRHGDAVARASGWTGCAKRSSRRRGLLAGGPVTFDGRYHRAAARSNDPPAVQQPAAVFVGGKGDRLLALVAELADGWNTCWAWTPEDYRERSTCSTGPARRSAATRPRYGERSASTRCAARTRPTWPPASSACGAGPAGHARRRRPSTSGGWAGWSARPSRWGAGGEWGASGSRLIVWRGPGPLLRHRSRRSRDAGGARA